MMGILLILSQAPAPPGQEELLDKVVAVVGDEAITMAQLENLYVVYASQLPPGIDQAAAKKRILDEMINQRLLYMEAKADTTIHVTGEEIDDALRQQLKTLKEQLGEENFKKQLEAEGITEDQLKDMLRDNVKTSLYIQKLVDSRIKPNIVVTQDEVKKFYDENKDSVAVEPGSFKLAHVLIRMEASGPAEQEAYSKAKGLVKQLAQGMDFAELASRYSDDRQSAQQGGNIGWVPKAMLTPDIIKELDRLEPGGISKPLRAETGYHIFQLVDKKKDAYYLRDIVISVMPEPSDSARALRKAKRVLKLARAGRKFSDLARTYSDDPSTKELGGDLGWIPENVMSPDIKDAVKDAKPGDIVGPVATPMGYTVIKVLDKKDRVVHSFEETQDFIKNYLYQQKIQDELNKLVERIKKRVYVDIRL